MFLRPPTNLNLILRLPWSSFSLFMWEVWFYRYPNLLSKTIKKHYALECIIITIITEKHCTTNEGLKYIRGNDCGCWGEIWFGNISGEPNVNIWHIGSSGGGSHDASVSLTRLSHARSSTFDLPLWYHHAIYLRSPVAYNTSMVFK